MSIIQQKYIICKDVFLNIHDMNVVNTLDSKIISLFEYKRKLYYEICDIVCKLEECKPSLGDILHESGRSNSTSKSQPSLRAVLNKKYNNVLKLIEKVNDKIVKNKRRLKMKIERMNIKDKTLNLEFKELDTDEDYDEHSNLDSHIVIMETLQDEEYIFNSENN